MTELKPFSIVEWNAYLESFLPDKLDGYHAVVLPDGVVDIRLRFGEGQDEVRRRCVVTVVLGVANERGGRVVVKSTRLPLWLSRLCDVVVTR